MSKFIIFASARSGSTSLARVLGQSSSVKMAIEPFHPGFSKWNSGEKDYSSLINSVDSMNQALDEIFSKYTAIKVLNYQFNENIYSAMLSRKEFKILYLKRRNTAEQVLSNLVAEQVGEYHKQENQDIYKRLKPIDINKMNEIKEYLDSMNIFYEDFLNKKRKNDCMYLEYESLYSDDFDVNKNKLTQICSFLQIQIPNDEDIEKYMTPRLAKINFDNIYKNIPNYLEIENEFGKLF